MFNAIWAALTLRGFGARRMVVRQVLKLLPKFIKKVTNGSEILHLKTRPLPLGVYEIQNEETGENTGIYVEVVTVGKIGGEKIHKDWWTTLSNLHIKFGDKMFGFSSYEEFTNFYLSYLKDCDSAYLHRFVRVEEPGGDNDK